MKKSLINKKSGYTTSYFELYWNLYSKHQLTEYRLVYSLAKLCFVNLMSS